MKNVLKDSWGWRDGAIIKKKVRDTVLVSFMNCSSRPQWPRGSFGGFQYQLSLGSEKVP